MIPVPVLDPVPIQDLGLPEQNVVLVRQHTAITQADTKRIMGMNVRSVQNPHGEGRQHLGTFGNVKILFF